MWSGPPDGKAPGEAQPPDERDAIAADPADPAAPPPSIESSLQASLGLPVSQSIPNLGLETPPSVPQANFPLAAQGLQTAANNAPMSVSLTDSILAHLQRNLTQGSMTTTENLVAMMGLLSPVAPGIRSGLTLAPPAPQSIAGQLAALHGPSAALTASRALPQLASSTSGPSHAGEASGSGTHGPRRDHTGESEENSPEEEDHNDGKRKNPPLSEEQRKKRRQEINRQSARRIRERRGLEMEDLRTKVSQLTSHVDTILQFAANQTRDKDRLSQQILDLTTRLHQALAENLELKQSLQEAGLPIPTAGGRALAAHSDARLSVPAQARPVPVEATATHLPPSSGTTSRPAASS